MRKILTKTIGYLIGLPFIVLFCYVIGPIVGLALGFSGLFMLTLLAGRQGIQAFYRGMILGRGPGDLPAAEKQVQGHQVK
ncbi:hypothetical protein [Vreelandella massiliensis]|uniref:hypothetical protein n=1 Tax=Vreelandella massiliensis TaxID=1816686 RepID=UPI00096A7A15|nr:hypothetical protein [Halomonas massiliensis]